MATYIQINNINEGDLDSGDQILDQFDASDTRFVEIIDGDHSKVREANFSIIYTKEELLENLEDGDSVCVSKDTKIDFEFFKKSGLEKSDGFWSSDAIFTK